MTSVTKNITLFKNYLKQMVIISEKSKALPAFDEIKNYYIRGTKIVLFIKCKELSA